MKSALTSLALALLATPLLLVAAPKKSTSTPATAATPAKAATATAKLDINPKEFGPLSTIELKFSMPMIPKEKVGTVAELSPLDIVPNLPGKFEWTSTRSGIYRLDQAPKFDSSYRFSLHPGLKTMDGQTVAAEKLRDCMTEKFRIVEQYPKWFDDDNVSRTPKFLFEFNDPVALESVAPAFKFKNALNKQVIDATARLATGKDFKDHYEDPHQTWTEQVAGTQPQLKPEDIRESAVVIDPVRPLDPGKDWTLEIAATVVNKINTSKLDTGDSIKLGTVLPFAITGIYARTPFDAKPRVDVDFNKALGTATPLTGDAKVDRPAIAAAAGPHVTIDPPVADAVFTVHEDNTLSVSGSFELHKDYHVAVAPEMFSADGLKVVEKAEAVVTFIPNPPYVSAPSFVNAQLATGKGEFEYSAANVTQVRMRAKRMSGDDLLKAIELYAPYQQTHGGSREEVAKFKLTPFDEFPGKVVFERTFPMNKALDQSSLTKLNWKEVLGDTTAAPLFIELEGTAMQGVAGHASIAQTIVEFTDIGLFQKDDFQTSTVLAVSLATGKPLPKVRVTLVNKEHKVLGTGETNANGLANVAGEDVAYVLAENGTDCTAMQASGYNTLVPLWHFGLNTAWNSPWAERRKTFMYADRPLFKPGETAHLKAYTRLAIADDLKLDAKPTKATLKIFDPRGKAVLEKTATFSAAGSWSDDVLLPSTPTGWYRASLTFTGGNDDNDNYGSGTLNFRVDDYRPNTFEVKFDLANLSVQPDRVKVPMLASYFMGKPLTEAKVHWNAFRMEDSTFPEQYADYHFGDAPAWAAYGQDRDADAASEGRHNRTEEWSASGEGTIDDEGRLTIEMATPPAIASPLPQRLRVEAEVTDINEQTIGGSTEIKLPGPELMLGLKSEGYFCTAGKETHIEAVAITPEGKAYSSDVPVKIKLERQSYHSLKVQTAGGGETTKNQVVLEEELNTTAVLHAATPNHPASLSQAITPKQGGSYFFTMEAEVNGKHIFSRMPVWVLGGDYPWAVHDGVNIDLQADKTTLKAGDKATIVVKSPIAGNALVTVERNKIHRSFQATITPEHPVIEVPVTADDAPNMYVSVVLIRGAKDSPQTVKMPDYRLGYIQLTVESNTNELAVTVKPAQETVKPGELASITATVLDSQGKPVPNAEVTLAAVDEGVLSLMSYVTPNPSIYFDEPSPLAIRTHSNFGDIITEDSDTRERGNKGYVIGGGGDENESALPDRKNFLATALWTATSITDASGAVKTSFTAPDNLTRFRLMAIASEGVRRFGSADSAVVVSKPLMVEPALPRFARVADEVLVKAVIHNTTDKEGEAEVELKLDDHAGFIAEERTFVLASLNPGKSKPDGKTWKKTVHVKAKETLAASFPVIFQKTGEAKWHWQVKMGDLNDATESAFNVEHPMQEKREVHYYHIAGNKLPENLAKEIHPTLLEGDGTVSVTLSTSRLVEVRDALDYVLHYPYGCVEQTTSAMIPWLALGGFNEMFPGQIDKAKSKEAIQTGVNRLLSMVTDRGGLAYWPGGKEPTVFASAYGGLGLLKAKEAGAAVPKQVVDELLAWLSQSLRHVDDERDTTTLVDDALALYTLAKGGRPEPAYENMLYLRRAKMPSTGKLYLALAKCISGAPEAEIRDLVGIGEKSSGSSDPSTWSYFTGSKVNNAFKLLVYAHIGEKASADTLADAVLGLRNGRGEWGNTYTNAWMLTALAGYERSLKLEQGPLSAEVAWGDHKETLQVPSAVVSAKTTYLLNKDLSTQPLKLTMPVERSVVARVEANAWPQLTEFKGENAGYGITRVYEKLLPDGNTEDTSNLHVGDMVIVRLTIDLPVGNDRYLAINDPLPAVFEAINPEFDTQNVRRNAAPAGVESWFCDFRELRTDRALFFTDYCPGKGKFELNYLARVVAEGDVIAPSASIEAMYEPAKHGLSETQRIKTLPSDPGKNVAEK